MEFIAPPKLIDDLITSGINADKILILITILSILLLSTALKRLIARRRTTLKAYPKFKFHTDSVRPNPADPLSQLDIVRRSTYEKVRILNKEEAKLLPLLERALRDLNQGHRVMAQTSLGEVIKPKSTNPDTHNAMAVINSKRLDFAVIDRFGWLVCAVEYQGGGHHQNGAFLRDAVKREALRKAGVPMIEVLPDFRPETLTQSLRDTISA